MATLKKRPYLAAVIGISAILLLAFIGVQASGGDMHMFLHSLK